MKAIRPILILAFALLACGVAARAANQTQHSAVASAHTDQFTCFTLKPPKYDGKKWHTCDEICATKNAQCTGVQSVINPSGCELPVESLISTCRCCALRH